MKKLFDLDFICIDGLYIRPEEIVAINPDDDRTEVVLKNGSCFVLSKSIDYTIEDIKKQYEQCSY